MTLTRSETDKLIKEVSEAWLITDCTNSTTKLIAILEHQISGEEMRHIVDRLYRILYSSPIDQLLHASKNQELRSNFFYLNDGTIFQDAIVLRIEYLVFARRVHHLKLYQDERGNQYLHWWQKNITRRENAETNEWWDEVWWEDDLTLELQT